MGRRPSDDGTGPPGYPGNVDNPINSSELPPPPPRTGSNGRIVRRHSSRTKNERKPSRDGALPPRTGSGAAVGDEGQDGKFHPQGGLIHKVGQECLSPIRMRSDQQGGSRAGYMRGEMLTPSPPANWHGTPGTHLGKDSDMEFKNAYDDDNPERAPLDTAGEEGEGDLEAGEAHAKKFERLTRRINYLTVGITHLLIGYILGKRVWIIIYNSLQDGYWLRCVALAYIPPAYVFMLFSIDYLVAQCVYALGPIAHLQKNSKFFSSVPLPRPPVLPRVTIQMAVYKESLAETILPSIQSVTSAILHYKKVGGEATLLVCDDGMQVIDEKDRDLRIHAYRKHGVAFVARPHPSVRPRKGLFKKASNLNYSLNVADRVEVVCNSGVDGVEVTPETALQIVSQEYNDEFIGGGDVRMGEVILLVDSDTRVPEDCLAKVAGEFLQDTHVGFMQCKTTSIRINDNYWENMIARFTNDVYQVGIAMAVSSGDPAPLVGHNAFLRWNAMKEVSWVDAKDGERKFWSERHVSEDFDLALRLQARGYIGRYCTYTGDAFQEGVSLTAADEVIRLRKYAYGSCEIMLNKFKDWPCKSPITKIFRRYLAARGVPLPAKIRMLAYLGTYIAMAFAFYGIVMYLGVWIFLPAALRFIVSPFDILITVCFVFGALSVFGAAMITYRNGYSKRTSLFRSFFEQARNAPVMLLFFSQVLWHLTVVCFRYFFDLKVEWTASVKEQDEYDFWTEIKNTFKRYWGCFLWMGFFTCIFIGMMIFFNVGWDLRVYIPPFIYTGAHFLGPFLLNPVIMRGYY